MAASFRTAGGTLLGLALLAAGCTSNGQQGQPFKLPSGRIIRILGIVPMHFTSGAAPALMLRYQTDLKTADKNHLRAEVDEIWPVLRHDAEKGNFAAAIISANEVPKGLILKEGHAYNFVYEKRSDGTWHCLDDDQPGSK